MRRIRHVSLYDIPFNPRIRATHPELIAAFLARDVFHMLREAGIDVTSEPQLKTFGAASSRFHILGFTVGVAPGQKEQVYRFIIGSGVGRQFEVREVPRKKPLQPV